MTIYCSECGAEIEDGMDFCVHCGALRQKAFDIDQAGNLRPVDENAMRVCPKCGFSFPYSEAKCPECGEVTETPRVQRQPKKLDTKDWIAVIVGLVAGVAGVCGIGHLIIGRYSRGIMYIILSGIFLYVLIASGFYFGGGTRGIFMIRLLSFMIFFHSAMDLFQSVYFPPEPPKEPKEEE